MAKRQAFTRQIVIRRYYRQRGCCALCGSKIALDVPTGKRGAFDAHHIDGDRSNGSFANCALVCRKGCHLQAHCGDFSGPYVLSRRAFRLTGWRDKDSRNRAA